MNEPRYLTIPYIVFEYGARNDLTLPECILLAEVASYRDGYYGTNDRIATKLNVTKRTVQRFFEKMVALGVLDREETTHRTGRIYRLTSAASTALMNFNTDADGLVQQGVSDCHPGRVTDCPRGDDKLTPKKNHSSKNSKEKEQLFAFFWSLYPKKQDKPAALKAFARIPANLHDELFAGLSREIEYRADAVQRGQWVPNWKNPATWLNAHSWENELEEPKPPTARQYKTLDEVLT